MELFLFYQQVLVERFQSLLEVRSGALFLSLLLGRGLMNVGDLRSQVKVTGTLYFFVISGLHISILAQMITQLLSKTQLSTVFRKGIVFAVVSIYGGLVGFSIPIIRTLSMRLHALVSTVFHRSTSPQYVFLASVLLVVIAVIFQKQ